MANAPVLLILRLATAMALYAFLAWALYVLWSDLKRQAQHLAARQAPPITLQLGIDGETHRFTSPEINIGRDPTCDFCLEDKTVSAMHARLVYRHNHWWIEDAGSTNGTYLNQELLNTPAVITDGDFLRCGQIGFSVLLGDAAYSQPEPVDIRNDSH